MTSYFKSLVALPLALGLAFAPVGVSSQSPLASISGASAAHAEGRPKPVGRSHYYRYRGDHGHYRGHYRGHRRYYRGHRRHNGGAALGAAIIGLGVGAAIASSPRHYERGYAGHPRPWTREWYRYCSARYRSFDARSGTFQPYHGPRQLCR
ncbi:BA14K family protein [Mangrovibrevibacter kandeliae]|uniref:BA14K family protein n=1 Tax=Mangrovibrevibacter kandeliae TaxID=2968473 RepID=UPI0021179D67|nr:MULTISPECIES: BA14K family protein [unclassified Aurantimonas]MCQ8781494.1 BA14K family protein [Aurantimonas sp. CSK15Z-1]MCW4114271.1 BA14K family protein [Aurantimonas sp. MSK8Z-1]